MPSDKEKPVNMIKSCVDSLGRGAPETFVEWNSLFQLVLGIILKTLEHQMSDELLTSVAEKFNNGMANKVIDIIAIVDEANIANEQAQKKKVRSETPTTHDCRELGSRGNQKGGRSDHGHAAGYNGYLAKRVAENGGTPGEQL